MMKFKIFGIELLKIILGIIGGLIALPIGLIIAAITSICYFIYIIFISISFAISFIFDIADNYFYDYDSINNYSKYLEDHSEEEGD